MGAFKDLTGMRFGKLHVIEMTRDKDTNEILWKCQCDCGNYKYVPSSGLNSGNVKSCGCLARKHGMGRSRLFRVWSHMKGRCLNPTDKQYHDYGGRNITICNEWIDDFIKFRDWAYENGYEATLSLDRIDNNKGYSPDNCRWATDKMQANNRRSNINIEIGSERKTLSQWAEDTGLDYMPLYHIYRKRGIEQAKQVIQSKQKQGEETQHGEREELRTEG